MDFKISSRLRSRDNKIHATQLLRAVVLIARKRIHTHFRAVPLHSHGHRQNEKKRRNVHWILAKSLPIWTIVRSLIVCAILIGICHTLTPHTYIYINSHHIPYGKSNCLSIQSISIDGPRLMQLIWAIIYTIIFHR